MIDYVRVGNLNVAKTLFEFVSDEALPGTGVSAAAFWSGLDSIVHALSPRNGELLAARNRLQAAIDDWHLQNRQLPINVANYRTFLAGIGYLVPEGPDFGIDTAKIDDEIARVAGPQLVVPISNARYALLPMHAGARSTMRSTARMRSRASQPRGSTPASTPLASHR
jgi:malate synthase